MKIKKNLFFAFLLLAAFLILYFIIKPTNNKNQITNHFERKVEKILKPDSMIESTTVSGMYRLHAFGDSIFFISDKGAFIANKNFSFIRPIKNFASKSVIYYFEKLQDTIVYFDVDQRKLFLNASDSHYSKNIEGVPGNAIFLKGEFLYSESQNNLSADKELIKSWNPVNNIEETKLDLNTFLKSELMGCKDCLLNTLEGNFFKVDDETWGYLFYVGGYFLISRNKSFHLFQTIDKTPFRKYELRTVDIGNSQKATICYSDNNSFINYTAVSNGKMIYILSGKIILKKDEELYAPIDVYDTKDFRYRYSFKAPMKDKNNYPYLMTIVQGYLYLFYKNGQLSRFRIL